MSRQRLTGEKACARDGGLRGRRCCFGRRHASASRRSGLTPTRRRHGCRHLHIHTNRSDGLRQPGRGRGGGGACGTEIHRLHGPWRRDAAAGSAAVSIRRAVSRRRGDQHQRAATTSRSTCRSRRIRSAGEPRDVVEDVRRLGGFGIAAHPDSPKAQLRWIDWTAPIDGVEMLNLDTSWRVLASQPGLAGKRRLFTALLDYPFRPTEIVTSLIQPTSASQNGRQPPRNGRSSRLAAPMRTQGCRC